MGSPKWMFGLIGLALLVSCSIGMPMVLNEDVNNLYQSTQQYSESDVQVSEHSANLDSNPQYVQYYQEEAEDLSLSSSVSHHASHHASHGFSSWANWGGHWTSDPQCTSLKEEGLDAFTVGLDGLVYYRAGHHKRLHRWEKIPGKKCRFPPAVAVQRDGSIDLVIQGVDNVIYYTRRDRRHGWQKYESLHFQSHRRPALAPWYHRGLFIFAIGTDGQMYKLERRHHRWFRGDSRGDWVCLGGSWSGGVTGGYISGRKLSDDVYVMAYDTSGYLQYTRFHVHSSNAKLGNWVGHWTNLHILGTLTPDISARPDGFDVVVRTTTGQIAVNSYNLKGDSWVGWTNLEFASPTIPAIASHHSGLLYLFVLDHDHNLYTCHRAQQNEQFSSWSKLGGPFTSSPSALVRENHYVDVFILDGHHSLVHASNRF